MMYEALGTLIGCSGLMGFNFQCSYQRKMQPGINSGNICDVPVNCDI